MKILKCLVATVFLLAAACGGDPEVVETQEPTPEPSPTPTPTFQLEGTVVEASGSASGEEASGQQAASPSPAATATPSPTASPQASPTDEAEQGQTPGQTQGQRTAIEQAAPGSLALRLSSYSGQDTACRFGEGDTVVIVYTSTTSFDPAAVTGEERFPNNLVNAEVAVQGLVLDEESCVLVASSVSVRDQVQASPTAPAAGAARATPRTSPTPRRASPTPARQTPASPTATQTTPTATDTPTDDPGTGSNNGSDPGEGVGEGLTDLLDPGGEEE